LGVVDDADDQNFITLDGVKYPMLAVDETANAFAKFGIGGPRHWVAAEQAKHFQKSQIVSIRHVWAKLFDTILANADEIGTRRATQPKLSHGVPGTPP
jgi:hypothetical protein